MARSALKLVIFSILLVTAGCGKPNEKGRETTFVTNGPARYQETEDSTPEPVPYFMQREERQSPLPPFEVPENIRTRINQEIPDFVPLPSTKFRVINHNLKINVATSTMTFTGVLQINGKADENIEL